MAKFIVQIRETVITSWIVEADNPELAESEIMSGGGLRVGDDSRDFDEIVSVSPA